MISGADEVTRRFREVMQQIGGNLSERAVTEVLVDVEGFTAPMIPIATSNLLNSQYRQVQPRFGGWSGEIGYSANYAQYVHDAPGTLLGTNTPRSPARLGNVWGPNGEPQFLKKGAEMTIQFSLRGILQSYYGVVR